ncbi:hypothetical protein [Rhodoplanes serenus]|uniref:hypothetical protein n=1 Tax=Rhodoplanes serenus TaxID=200615 RepID=UPI003F596BBF
MISAVLLNMVRGKNLHALGNTPGHYQYWTRHMFVDFIGTRSDIVSVTDPVPWTVVRCRPRVVSASNWGLEDPLQPLCAMGREGVWKNLFHALASAGGPPEQVLISAAMPSRTSGRASRRPDQRKKKAARRSRRPKSREETPKEGNVADRGPATPP